MEYPERVRVMPTEGTRQMTTRSLVGVTTASVLAGGPLLGLMCFSFFATATLFLVSLALLLLFSPVLARAVLADAMVGFLVAGTMWLAGIFSTGVVRKANRIVSEKIIKWMGIRVKKLGQEWSHYLWNKTDGDIPHAAHSSEFKTEIFSD